MKRRKGPVVWLVVLLVATALPGCGWFGGEQNEEFDEPIPDGGSADHTTEAEAAKQAAKQEKLELKLSVGDRFPLMKTVEQTLTQPHAKGPTISETKLELLLAINVEEIRDGRKRLGVRYHRVRYWQNIAGEKLTYDSSAVQAPIPVEAQVYNGLVNNGFSFWIGPDNKILELVGFGDFLKRCVRDIPPSGREALMAKLVQMSGDDGIANFVDDSIGLLPYNVEGSRRGSLVKVGDTWTRERWFQTPIPLYLHSKCTLKELNENVAEIDIVGNIATATPYGPRSSENNAVNVTVRGGHSFGSCTIDRNSGLPINARIERYFEMVVKLANETEFVQHKKIVTTVRAFPQAGVTKMTATSAADGHSSGSRTPARISDASERTPRQ